MPAARHPPLGNQHTRPPHIWTNAKKWRHASTVGATPAIGPGIGGADCCAGATVGIRIANRPPPSSRRDDRISSAPVNTWGRERSDAAQSKPIERWGRRATGLTRGFLAMLAGSPANRQSSCRSCRPIFTSRFRGVPGGVGGLTKGAPSGGRVGGGAGGGCRRAESAIHTVGGVPC